MNFPLSAQAKLSAVLVTALLLLGCQAPVSDASEETPAVNPVALAPAPAVATSEAASPATLTAEAVPAAVTAPQATEGSSATNLVQTPPARPVDLPEHLREVVKLAESGVGDEVILAFIQNSATAYNPTPEQIVYLTDLGLSDVVITALVNHHPAQAPAPVAQQAAPAPPPSTTGPNLVETNAIASPTYNPEPQVVYSSPPVVQYTTPAPADEYSYFYSSLAPYGSWVEVPDYGVCWQPMVAVVDQGWRPYGDRGRWMYTDCGWYWQSDYSWGWAPFHYGRWFHHPARGWCWRPGDVWAPAWVSWRYSDSYCGWAPLPPGAHYAAGAGFTYYGAHVGVSFSFGLGSDCWTFVPAHRMHDHDVWRYHVGHEHVREVYHNSHVVNNYVVNNNVIVNQGISHRQVPALARAEVAKVQVRELPERGSALRPDRVHQEGAQAVVYRPKGPPPSARSPAQVGSPTRVETPQQANANLRSRSEPSPNAGRFNRTGPSGFQAGGLSRTSSTPDRTATSSQPAASGVARTEPVAPTASQTTRIPNTYNPRRSEPAPSTFSGRNSTVLPSSTAAQSNPAQRQELPKSSVATAGTPDPAAARYRTTPSTVNRSWAQPNSGGANQVYQRPRVSTAESAPSPGPMVRQETPKPSVGVAAERVNTPPAAAWSQRGPVVSRSSPQPSYNVPGPVSRPTMNVPPAAVYSSPGPVTRSMPAQPNYAAPARSVPSYSPAQTRSAPVVSTPAPASRPAPQSSGSSSSGSRRTQN